MGREPTSRLVHTGHAEDLLIISGTAVSKAVSSLQEARGISVEA